MRAACPPKATDYAITESLMYSRGIKNKKRLVFYYTNHPERCFSENLNRILVIVNHISNKVDLISVTRSKLR